jgi:hypothetical protein
VGFELILVIGICSVADCASSGAVDLMVLAGREAQSVGVEQRPLKERSQQRDT